MTTACASGWLTPPAAPASTAYWRPSAGLAGERTLAVFFAAVDEGKVVEETSRVQVPPLDLVRHLGRVRPLPAAAAAVAAFLTRLRQSSYAALRRRYRRR